MSLPVSISTTAAGADSNRRKGTGFPGSAGVPVAGTGGGVTDLRVAVTRAKRSLTLTLVLWITAVTLIYGVNEITAGINGMAGTSWQAQHLFLVIGCLAGMGLGATQSACRAMVGLFSPDTKSGEFFGLWNLTGKLAAIFGLMSLGFFQNSFGLKNAILICSIFFFIAIIVLAFVNEERGKASALDHAGE